MCLNIIDVRATVAFVLLALASTPQLRAVLCRDPEQIGLFVERFYDWSRPNPGLWCECVPATPQSAV